MRRQPITFAPQLCWWVMNDLLQGFAYRIHIGPAVFIESGLMALAIVLATMTQQALKAAMGNTMKSLRFE